MRNLNINDNLISWTKSFLINKLRKLVIDRFINIKKIVESLYCENHLFF